MKKLLHTFRTSAALITLLVFSASVYSQTVISSINAEKSATLLSKQFSKTVSEENNIQKETKNWMSNKGYLDVSSQLSAKEMFIINEKVLEKQRSIEEWMVNSSSWQLVKPLKEEFIDEESKTLEEWMFDESFWNIQDDKMFYPVESWMTDSKFWVMVD